MARMLPALRLRGSTPDLYWVYSLAFPPPGGSRKATGPSPWPGLVASSAVAAVGKNLIRLIRRWVSRTPWIFRQVLGRPRIRFSENHVKVLL